jgi:hypothetical protein
MISRQVQDYLDAEGYESLEDICAAYIHDTVVPGVCTKCGESEQVEHDCRDGWCETCHTNTVKSPYILLGVI